MSPPPRWRSALSILLLIATLAAILFTIVRLLPIRIGGAAAGELDRRPDALPSGARGDAELDIQPPEDSRG